MIIPENQIASSGNTLISGKWRTGRVIMLFGNRVVHFGPSMSKGGMSSVMSILENNPPDGWIADSVPTHSDRGVLDKIKSYYSARKRLNSMIKEGEINIAHFHVTHSMSWWRKQSLIRICQKNGLPTIVHIHSGKFDSFCKGIAGKNVSKLLARKGVKTIVIEERWLKILDRWLPRNAQVVNNSSIKQKSKNKIGKKSPGVRLFLGARKSKSKGHSFALNVLEELHKLGVKAELIMTGVRGVPPTFPLIDYVNTLGWISEREYFEELLSSDFVLVPSDYEGSSMTVIESIVNGIPCIVSPTSSETVGNIDLVASLESPKEWAEKIIKLSEKEELMRIKEYLSRLSEKYSVELARNKFGEIYSGMILESSNIA